VTKNKSIDEGIAALQDQRVSTADRILSAAEEAAFRSQDWQTLAAIWPKLAEARTKRRERAAGGRIDLHTHTTASDGNFTVEQSLCEHFVRGQILINDHNCIESLAPARQLVHNRDLELDVFLGIEVICTNDLRAFECNVIAPTLSPEFVELCGEHRQHWDRAAELFIEDIAKSGQLFQTELWGRIAGHFEVGGDFARVMVVHEEIRNRVASSKESFESYLRGNQTFDMGNTWHAWKLATPGDPPMLAHRVFASMRCYAMNAYRDALGDWFDYEPLMNRFHGVGCFISHNHPNYWDEDFIGELRHEEQTRWVEDWARRGVIDALEVWSPPFASKRVPHYWERVCKSLDLTPMAGTDCHSGREQEFGGKVEDHPEIPPQIYAKLTKRAAQEAAQASEPWAALAAWRNVLAIDYAHPEALERCGSIVQAASRESLR
jgi:hypothetical protein